MIQPPYPWDCWAEHAEEVGIPEDLIDLGCRVMRQAYVHHWNGHAYELCVGHGITANMTIFAKRAPKLAVRLWTLLLETQGLTIFNDEQNGELLDFAISLPVYDGEAYL